jgi:hypothetical protein
MQLLHRRQLDAALGAEVLVGAGQPRLGAHRGSVHEGERQLAPGDQLADRLDREAGGVPGLEEPQPGGILDREPANRLPLLECSPPESALHEGRVDLGQPSQLISRQPDTIHVASFLPTLVLSRDTPKAGIVGDFMG